MKNRIKKGITSWQAVRAVAREEWRSMVRSRVALSAVVVMLLLTLTATLVGFEHRHAIESERGRFQALADQQWHGQPDRHPHRVSHYGHYVFRPLSPLAFFDFGVDPFTGHTLYLEGHRQNSANFSDAGQSSVLLRFGLLTPAFVLQTLVPLLIGFLAFGSIARERERGQLRFSIAQGIPGRSLLLGKLLAHALVAGLLALPAFAGIAYLAMTSPAAAPAALFMLGGYALYLLLWSCAAVGISACAARARDALIMFTGLWIVMVILLPRLVPDLASHRITLPTRIETDVAIHKDLAAIGDSHNPDDPYFRGFREQTLARYGVKTVEDLPVNYGGLLMAEGERLTSELFDRYMQDSFGRQQEQSRWVYAFSPLSPAIALRRLSAALAGSDLDSHARFLQDAEQYRYALIQALNRMHTEQVHYHNDKEQRIGQHNWQALPRFSPAHYPFSSVLQAHVLPSLAILGSWLAALMLAVALLGKRLERKAA